jgi:hypothetical protein
MLTGLSKHGISRAGGQPQKCHSLTVSSKKPNLARGRLFSMNITASCKELNKVALVVLDQEATYTHFFVFEDGRFDAVFFELGGDHIEIPLRDNETRLDQARQRSFIVNSRERFAIMVDQFDIHVVPTQDNRLGGNPGRLSALHQAKTKIRLVPMLSGIEICYHNSKKGTCAMKAVTSVAGD